MKLITVEEHLAWDPLRRELGKYLGEELTCLQQAGAAGLPLTADPALYTDPDHARLADMDRYGIAMQLLSCPLKAQYLPPAEAPALVRVCNDHLAEVMGRHPDRYGAFGLLPWSDPAAAVREAQRIASLGFHGVLLAGGMDQEGTFLDHPRYLPVLEACQDLGLPLYLHPAVPLKGVREPYYGGLGETLSARLALHGWGWHHEAGVQLLRVILVGRCDQFPRLRLIVGHWGEMVPFFLSRLDHSLPQRVTGLARTVTETVREQVYVTPSGMFDLPQLNFCLEVLGAERILYSVDCPFLSNEQALPFLENAPLSQEEKEKIAHGNAERLFHLV